MVSNITSKTISGHLVICGSENLKENHFISLISYWIYKDWLKQSFEGQKRTFANTTHFIVKEINWYSAVYSATKFKNLVDLLDLMKADLIL